MEVNIYTYTTAKAAKNKTVGFAYVIEAIINGKAATVSKTGVLEDIGKNEAEIKVFKEALERVKSGNSINLNTKSQFVAAVLEGWLDKWMETGTNSKGEPIAKIYKEIANLLATRPIKVTEGEHEYLKWLIAESERARDERSNN